KGHIFELLADLNAELDGGEGEQSVFASPIIEQPFNTALIAPTVVIADDQVTLVWQKNSPSVDAYIIDVYEGSDDQGSNVANISIAAAVSVGQDLIATIGVGRQTVNDVLFKLFPGREYTFYVRAINLAGDYPDSARTKSNSITTRGVADRFILAPRIDQVVFLHDRVDIAWTAPSNHSSYEVTIYAGDRALSANAINNVPDYAVDTNIINSEIISFQATTYTYIGLSPDTQYTIQLIAIGGVAENGEFFANSPQAVSTFTTLKRIDVRLGANNNEQTEFFWGLIETATTYQYRIYQEGSVAPDFVMQNAASASSAVISFADIIPSNSNVFEVLAINNTSGNKLGFGRVLFNGALSRPSLVLQEVDGNSLRVSWQMVAQSESYIVDLYRGADDSGRFIQRQIIPDLNYEASDLLPGFDYTIYITASDSAGIYADSPRLKVTEAIIGSAPARLATPTIQKLIAAPDSIIVEWDEPANVLFYEINLYRDITRVPIASTTQALTIPTVIGSLPQEPRYVFNEVDHATFYTVEIIAIGDAMTYSDSLQASSSIETLQGKLSAPKNLRFAVDDTNGTLLIEWDEVILGQGGLLTATQVTYDIRYYRTNEQSNQIIRTGLNATQYLIENPEPATEYTIEIVARAPVFFSSDTASTTVQTQKIPLPSAEDATILLIVSENGVEIDWVAVPLLIERFDISVETNLNEAIIPKSSFVIDSRRNGTASFDNGSGNDRFTPGQDYTVLIQSIGDSARTNASEVYSIPFTFPSASVPVIVQTLNIRLSEAV
ncbi:MAG: hypothetical protein ACNYNY_00665, partial [Candidatus Oxydemutatoraceae bacterium WSBS_2016_MAG_OTU14]